MKAVKVPVGEYNTQVTLRSHEVTMLQTILESVTQDNGSAWAFTYRKFADDLIETLISATISS